MKRKRWLLSLALICVLGMVEAGYTKETPMVLRLAHFSPPKGLFATFLNKAVGEVEQLTEGRIKIEVYWSESLLKSKEMLRGVEKGICSIAFIAIGYYPSELPLNNVQVNVLYSPKARDGGWVARKAWEVMDGNKDLYGEFTKYAQTPWFVTPYDGYCVFSKKLIEGCSDIKGMRIRITSDGQAKFLAAIGGIPIWIAAADTYVGLEKGAVDGALATIEYGKRYGYHEVTRFVAETYLSTNYTVITASLRDLEKMTKKDREVFLEVGRRVSIEYGDAMKKEVNDNKALIEKAGVKIVPFPAEELHKWLKTAAAQKVQKDWIEEQNKAGRPGTKIMESFIKIFEVPQ
jgi:TRAP-type C4-dicarboxylate transport system substrate-binding protein